MLKHYRPVAYYLKTTDAFDSHIQSELANSPVFTSGTQGSETPPSLSRRPMRAFFQVFFFAGGFAAHNSAITKQKPRETSGRVQSRAVVFSRFSKKLRVSRNLKLVKHRGLSRDCQLYICIFFGAKSE